MHEINCIINYFIKKHPSNLTESAARFRPRHWLTQWQIRIPRSPRAGSPHRRAGWHWGPPCCCCRPRLRCRCRWWSPSRSWPCWGSSGCPVACASPRSETGPVCCCGERRPGKEASRHPPLPLKRKRVGGGLGRFRFCKSRRNQLLVNKLDRQRLGLNHVYDLHTKQTSELLEQGI